MLSSGKVIKIGGACGGRRPPVEETMSASSPRIPHIPAELIPLLDAALPRTAPPRRRSPQELATIRAGLTWAGEAFGTDSAPYRRCLLLAALEHARAEVGR